MFKQPPIEMLKHNFLIRNTIFLYSGTDLNSYRIQKREIPTLDEVNMVPIDVEKPIFVFQSRH